jgi:hypothetical protein
MTALTTLAWTDNNIEGTIPTQLARLTNLKSLSDHSPVLSDAFDTHPLIYLQVPSQQQQHEWHYSHRNLPAQSD